MVVSVGTDRIFTLLVVINAAGVRVVVIVDVGVGVVMIVVGLLVVVGAGIVLVFVCGHICDCCGSGWCQH